MAVKWLVEEDGSEAAEALKAHELHAPTLIRLEAGNALRTITAQGGLTEEEARDAFALLLAAPVRLHEPDAGALADAFALALRLGHPLYDCAYLALASRLGTLVVTADRRLITVARMHAETAGLVLPLGEPIPGEPEGRA